MKPSRIMTFIMAIMTVLAVCLPTAFAASGDTSVVFGGGPVSISGISVASFGQITLTCLNQTAQAAVGDFTITDARGNGKGWSVQVSATRFKNGTSMLHDGALTLSGTRGTAVGNSDNFDQSYIASPMTVTTTPAAYIVVPTSKGKGSYSFTGGNLSLDIWPSEVISGTYSSTVTFDVVPNVN
jgi:hypothetical protein